MDEEQRQLLKNTIYEAVNQSHSHFSKSISEIGSIVFKKETPMDKIRKNWMIIIFLISLFITVIASWVRLTEADAMYNSRISNLESKTVAMEEKVNVSNTEILSRLSKIQANQEWFSQDLMWIKSLFEKK